MTALERALVVYAEAKGYEIEVTGIGTYEWSLKGLHGFFNFATCDYRLRDPRNMHKVCNSLYAEYLPNIPEKSISEMVGNIKKYKPAGFSCKTKMYTREEIEEMNKPKEYVKQFKTDSPKLKRMLVSPFIMVMEAWADGKDIEVLVGNTGTWHIVTIPQWDFSKYVYRISPKQAEAIPATEEELEEVKSEPKPCFWIKDKKTGITWKLTEMGIGVMQDFYIFDKQTKTWQDWGSK